MIYVLIAALVVVAALAAWLGLGSRRTSSRSTGSRSTSSRSTSSSRVARTGVDEAPEVEAWAAAEAPQVMVVNRSSSPVHDLRAFVALGRSRRPTCVGWIRTLPPTGDEAARVALTADSRESWFRWRDSQPRGGGKVSVEVTFRDEAGQHWRRDRSGTLKAIEG